MATTLTERHTQNRVPGGFEMELVRGTVDTDGSGAGSLTIPIDGYGTAPAVITTSANTSAANVTANSFDLAVSGGPASSTVDVAALVAGPAGVA